MKDEEILDLYWNRSELAIPETASKYGRYCKEISYNILHSSEDAEECVNDTWLKTWDNIPPQRPGRLAAFLGRITRNLSLDRYRYYNAAKRGLSQTELALEELDECIPAGARPEEIVEGKMLTELIEKFLLTQPRQKRELFIRRYWYMYSVKNAAKDMGIKVGTAASILQRMRETLKSYLEKEGIEI